MPTHLGLTTSIRSSQSPTSDQATDQEGSLRQRVEQLTEELLWPAATEVDRGAELRRGHFDALSALGLYGMAIPAVAGGLGLPQSEIRTVLRTLGSGCGVTAFAFAQHHGTAGSVAATKNTALREQWLPKLATDRLAGIAYAHVRRKGSPVLSAEPDGDGWRLSGTAPWVTSWGLAEVNAVAANTADGRLVWALVSAVETEGLSVSRTFELMVYGATQTVALAFDGLAVPAEQVISVVDFDTWATSDRLLAARPNPLCLGIGDRALAQIAIIDPGLAAAFAPWWQTVSDRAEEQCLAVEKALADRSVTESADHAELLAAVAAARAESLVAVQRLCTALLAATGGAAMETGHAAQRLNREALFYVIQAQSGDGRQAMLGRLRPDNN